MGAVRPLCQLAEGQEAVIASLGGSGAIRQRLLDMGITRGAELRVERRAPLGDPIEIRVKGYYLALRRDEARDILVEERAAAPAGGPGPGPGPCHPEECDRERCQGRGRGRGWRHRFGFGRRGE